VDLKFDQIPMIWYDGSHRIANGISIYGGERLFSLGLMDFAAVGGTNPSPWSSGTINRYYDECWTPNTGELARFSGSAWDIDGGSLGQCAGSSYVNWEASLSTINAQVTTALQVNGNSNTFTNIPSGIQVTDNGLGNSVLGNNDSYGTGVNYYMNYARSPLNRLDGGFLLSGNSTSPFYSGSDLLITCNQFNFMFQPTDIGCTNDPTGTEVTKSYAHMLASNFPTGWGFGPGSSGNGPYGKLLLVGDRVPRGQVTFVIQGRCDAACTQMIYIRDYTQGNATVGSFTASFGTAWTTQTYSLNLGAQNVGDQISLAGNVPGGSGVTYEDIAYMGFEPLNSDTINATLNSSSFRNIVNLLASTTTCTAQNWLWSSLDGGVVDASSPVGYSTNVPNSWSLSACAGSTNMNGGALYAAVPSKITITTQGPAITTDTVAVAQASTDTTLSITTGVPSTWLSTQLLLVGQEIEQCSGCTAGQTTITVTRHVGGTIAQSHSSGTAYYTIGSASLIVSCNGATEATGNLYFEPTWQSWSFPFSAQNCSGYATTIKFSYESGATGQQFNTASLAFTGTPNIGGAFTSNDVLCANSAEGDIKDCGKALAGSGAAIPTGPNSGITSGHGVCYTGSGGQQADCGYAPPNLSISGTPSAGKATCWKASGQIGYCSTQPDSTGSCTCN
jgi:hypothetical protein